MATKKTIKKKSSRTVDRSAVTGRFLEKSSELKKSMVSYASSGTSVHVIPRQGGGWAVKKEGVSRASKVHSTKASAVDHGKEIARKREGQVVIHRKDGSFEKRVVPFKTKISIKTKTSDKVKLSAKVKTEKTNGK